MGNKKKKMCKEEITTEKETKDDKGKQRKKWKEN